ncbi:outer membrane protein [Hyphococcus sp.]|uniref:outer membrane protein n=1 Tax=Hyphococcus sp. TaxID=2038636 RepID=UPI003D14B99B
MKNRFLPIIAGIAAISASAAAQDAPVEDGAYIRLGAGVSIAGDWEQDLAFNMDPSGPFSAGSLPPTEQQLDFSEGLTAAAALGFDYADGIRTELEYRYSKADIDQVTLLGGFTEENGSDPVSFDPDAEIKAHFLMTNFFFDFANSSPLTPFIGGGVGGAFVSNENAERDAALAYQGRAGVSLEMGTGFTADFEYIYLRTNELEFGPSADEFTAEGPFGRAATGDRYQSSSVMVSLRRRF